MKQARDWSQSEPRHDDEAIQDALSKAPQRPKGKARSELNLRFRSILHQLSNITKFFSHFHDILAQMQSGFIEFRAYTARLKSCQPQSRHDPSCKCTRSWSQDPAQGLAAPWLGAKAGY